MFTTNKIILEGNTVFLTGNPIGGLIGVFTVLAEDLNIPGYVFTTKLFRYTLNGVTYSDWQEVTIPNIEAIEFGQYDTVVFEFAYTKSTLDQDVPIDGITVDLTSTVAPLLTDAYRNTIFNLLFDSTDPRVLAWTVSVLKKIYEKGLLASFVGRFNKQDSVDDFVIIWKSIIQLFSYYVIYMREYETFWDSRSLLTEYLNQRGITTSPNNTLEELYLLMSSFHKQVSDRGTVKIIDNKEQDGKIIDGELLRLIQYRSDPAYDEFIFGLHKTQSFGWNIGNSSPLYRGLYVQNNFLKRITEPNTWIVSGGLDYETTFLIKAGDPVTISYSCKDRFGDAVDVYSAKTGAPTTVALEDFTLYRDDKNILVRVCLFNSEKEISDNDMLNINNGNNLILHENARTVTIQVTIGGVVQSLDALQLRFLPLFTPYSHGMLQVYNWISCWIENNNLSLTREELQAYARRYLIPYNSHIQLIEIEKREQFDSVTWDSEEITFDAETVTWDSI